MNLKKLFTANLCVILVFTLQLSSINVFAAPKNKKTNIPSSTSTSIKVQLYNYSTSASENTLYPEFRIYNNGSSTISLSSVKVRYYYTIDGEKAQTYRCDWSNKGSNNVIGSINKMSSASMNADYYVEIGFTSNAGSLASGTYVEVQSRIYKTDWSYYTQTNDYSFNNSSTTYTDWFKTTGYINSTLVWGNEPAIATPIPTSTPTPAATLVLTPTLSPTPTATPVPTATPSPTPITTPEPTKAAKNVLGYTTYYYSGDKSSYNSMVNNKDSISEISTATHITDGYGNITGILPTEQISFANSVGISPTLMVGNNFSGEIAKTLLESTANRNTFITNLLNILKTNNYRGVNIDIEGIYSTNRNNYTTFLSEIYSTLKPQGYTVSVAVPAKTTDNPNYTWNYAYDYASISNYADYIVLMTYDEHYPGGSPGPVASIGWVTNVIKYATTVIPNEKIYLGLAAYGYDWSTTGTKAYSINGCYNLATNNGATILWDNTSKCPYFTYTDTNGVPHTVWFENSMSIEPKLDLLSQYDLAGIGIWRLGLENSDYWNVINAKIR